MNILFHSNQLSERGSEVAMFDYALGYRNILGYHSFVATPQNNVLDNNVLDRFKRNFPTTLYGSPEELRDITASNKIDLVYKIVHGGEKENVIISGIPHFVHCVFSTKAEQGDFYCPISGFLNKWFGTEYPVLPHIVKKFSGNPNTLREKLNIPKDATVFGGYGGENMFNIPFVRKTVIETARARKDIFFLFMNFKPFADIGGASNIIFLPKNTDMEYKEKFINTCDAMIHARADGETFGLAVAEFSVKNKPVITWKPCAAKAFARHTLGLNYSYATAHLDFLGDKAILYSSPKDLEDIFLNFKEKYLRDVNYDCYSERFSEESVMRIFQNIISGSKNDKM